MRDPDDRTVHARLSSGLEIVRYDRSGKWYREYKNLRVRIGIKEAVSLAVAPDAVVHLDLPGGRAFDAKVRRNRA